ncbi:MAG TPA: hypothetical protein VJG67_00750 [Candidatus Paceibacterota bacterium]
MQKQNIGNAGEYYIASRLSAENFIATLTLGRAEKYDILALSPDGRAIKLSIKTAYRETAKSFILSAKDENGASNDFYYAFVRLNQFNKEPDFWIIPSKVVAPLIKHSQEIWMKTLGRKSQQHKETPMRQLPVSVIPTWEQFYPNWSKKVDQYYKNLKQLQ